MRLALSLSVILLSSPALADVEQAIVGTWAASMPGFDLTFKIDADGTCVFDGENGKCAARGGTLTWTGAEVTERYKYELAGNQLKISGGDMEMVVVFERKGGAPAAPPAAPPAGPPSAPVSPPANDAPPPPVKGGTPFAKESWGVKLVAPPGWKLVEKDGVVIGGHDSEAGLLVIRYLPKVTREQIVAEYQKGVQEQGLTASPTGDAKPWKAGGASGLAGELSGTSNDGQTVKIRSVAVMSPYGSALIVVGLTTAERYANLKTRVEQLASTVVMSKPKEAPAGDLAGAYAFIYVSKVGSYSRESYITLCKSGRFTRRGEMVGSGKVAEGVQGNAYSGNAGGGSWKAQGDASGGTLLLQFSDGGTAEVPYKVSTDPKDRSGYGPAVWIGNDLFQKNGSGDC